MSKKKQRLAAARRDHPFAYHHEMELEISTLTNRGIGLGRVPLPDDVTGETSSWVIMVPFSLPGERVKVRIFRNQKNFSEADLIAVLVASPDRVTPVCPLFGTCGGCQYQHFTYHAQLDWKRQQVEELLEHMAGLVFPVAPVIPSPRELGYRSKITPHYNPPRDNPEPMPLGFLRQGTRFDIVDVERCEIATEAINAALPAARADLHARQGSLSRGGTILLRDAGGHVTRDYDEVIEERVGDLKLRFLARDFFQNNPFILPAFTGYVRAQAAASGARFLVDAYCGSGLFALTAAPAFEAVQGIEISPSSIDFARANAAANGLAHVTFTAGDASAIFQGLEFPAAQTVVVIDPPRKGCDEAFLQQLFAYGPHTVVYISCDPATQMRDLVHFKESGYTVKAVQPFDLFPQTRHLECVVTLTRVPA